MDFHLKYIRYILTMHLQRPGTHQKQQFSLKAVALTLVRNRSK